MILVSRKLDVSIYHKECGRGPLRPLGGTICQSPYVHEPHIIGIINHSYR